MPGRYRRSMGELHNSERRRLKSRKMVDSRQRSISDGRWRFFPVDGCEKEMKDETRE